jgi:MEDS: MEthanogen/methylotroph, DcmR Sensory domain
VPPRPISHVRQGDHVCLCFDTDAERDEVLTTFLRAGVARGEKLIYLADSRPPGPVANWTEQYPLAVRESAGVYIPQGVFDPDRVAAGMWAELAIALGEGYRGLRLAAEMGWATRGVPGSERLLEYEAKVGAVCAGGTATGLCQYDRRRFAPEVCAAMVEVHDSATAADPPE